MYVSMLSFADCFSDVFFSEIRNSALILIHNIPWGLLLQLARLLLIGGIEANPGPSICCWCCGSTTDDDEETHPLLSDSHQNYSIQQTDPPIQQVTCVDSTPSYTNQHRRLKKSLSVDRSRKTSVGSLASPSVPWHSRNPFWSSNDSLFTPPQDQASRKHKSQTCSRPGGPKFTKLTGFADTAGQWFEVKMAALLFIRGLNQSQKFHLASNMKAGGSTDDIVFINGQRTLFLQLKHYKDPEKKITDAQLLQLTGKFSLFKYYKSYLEIQQQWTHDKDLKRCGRFEDALFVIYTNALMNFKGAADIYTEQLNILGTDGMYFRITEESHPHVYEMFDKVMKCKTLLAKESELESATPLIMNLGKKVWNLSEEKEIKSIWRELKNLEDLSNYKDFLSHLWFYTGQPGEEDLDEIIKQEITEALSTSQNETQSIFCKFLAEIYNWWNTSNRFLTESAELWEKIYLSHIDNISKQALNDIGRYNIQFESPTPFHTNNGKFLNIVVDGTRGSFELTSLKVHQWLAGKRHVVLQTSVLEKRKNEILSLWERWCDILVIIHDQNIQIDFLPDNPNKTLIYISDFQIQNADLVIHDKITLNHFDVNSRTQIMSAKVDFQGYEVCLGEVIGTRSEMLDFISADIIFRILLGEKIIIGSDLPRQIDYFIPRILECQHSLRSNFLCPEALQSKKKSTSSEVFAVSGLTHEEFELLIPNNREIISFEKWIKYYKTRTMEKCPFIIIKGKEEFCKLAECYENAHWIHGEKYTFKWKESKGDISIIQNNLNCATSYVNNIETVWDLPQKVILLSAEAGMGKTTLVDHLVCKAKETDPTKLIFNINLNESISELDALPQNMKLHDVSKYLLEMSGIQGDFREMFERKLENMKDVSIVLDGFDEVSPKHSNKVLLMMKLLLLTEINKLWITTRCSSKNHLERSLSTLCYNLSPFSENDQQNLIMEIWKKTNLDTSLLTDPCKRLLEWVSSNLNDRNKGFVAAPLQAMLLAYAFEDELTRCIQTSQIMIPKTLHLLKLFRNFINKKFFIYYNRYIVNEGSGVSFSMHWCEQHTYLALLTLLSPEEFYTLPNSHIILENAKEFINIFEKGQDHLGIIKDIVDGNPVFIHITFAEFFAAEWFSKNYSDLNDYMRAKLFDPLFQVTRHFLNMILAEKFNLHTAVLNNDKHEIERLISENVDINVRDTGGRTALHLAVMNSNAIDGEDGEFTNSEIIETLLSHGADHSLEDKVLKWRPLKIAGKLKFWLAINLLLQHGADTTDLVPVLNQISANEHDELLKIISKHGLVELLKFLMPYRISLNKYFNVTYPNGENSVTMLHEAVRHGHLRLVEFLLQNKVVIDARDSLHGRTPLILAAVNKYSDIRNLLTSHGASTELRDKSGYTAGLLTSHYTKQVKERICNNDVLQLAAVQGDVHKVNDLLEGTFDVNCVNSKMQTALWYAAWAGKLPVVELLLKRGADMHIQDTQWGWTPLHVAVRWGYLEIVDKLLQNGASLNYRDKNDLLPLDLALQKGHTTIVDYIRNRKYLK